MDKLGVKKEAEAFYQTVNATVTPAERDVIIKAGESLFWAIALRVLLKIGIPVSALGVIALTVLGSQATGQTPPGIATGPKTVVTQVVAFSPGTKFDVLAYCKNAKKVYIVPATQITIGVTRRAENSPQDYVQWFDGTNIETGSQNTSATRWYVGSDGKQASEPGLSVESKEAVECMRAQHS